MRGVDQQQSGMFSYLAAEQRVPQSHPLRRLRTLVEPVLKERPTPRSRCRRR